MANESGESKSDSFAFAWAAFFVAILAFVAAIGAFGFAVIDNDNAGASGGTETVEVTLSEMKIEPKQITVKAGALTTFKVTNKGSMAHDFWLESGEHTQMLNPGASETITATVSGSEKAYCNVPGHRAAGMEMTVNVEGSAAATQTGSADGAGGAKIDFAATAADDFVPRDPTAPVAEGTTNHEITLDAVDKQIEVAPGVTQTLWTFNGTTPGPTLRGKVGDVFTITLRNKGSIDHSIDFHASKVSWSDEMRSIKPGEELVYRFEAKHAGIFMYHCGTAPALHHIGNGMFGALIIDPPALPPVAKEYVLVQSELYLGPEGKEGDLTKMMNDDWDAVVFNGYVNQYRDKPIQVNANERIRVWVLDAGPSENSSFHIVGTIFDTVFKEGAYALQPDASRGGAQALDLQPAQGGFVEFTFDEDGFYPIVTHKFSNVGKGALGLFRAGDAAMPAAGGH